MYADPGRCEVQRSRLPPAAQALVLAATAAAREVPSTLTRTARTYMQALGFTQQCSLFMPVVYSVANLYHPAEGGQDESTVSGCTDPFMVESTGCHQVDR